MPTPAFTLEPLNRILDLSADGWTVWDVSPIDGPDGRVHLFATRWRALDRPDQLWYRGSQIVHATAEQPEGPYTIQDVVIEGRGGDDAWDASAIINAKIYRVDNRYALLYTGCRAQRHDTQCVGMLTAPSLDGPWSRVSDHAPLIAPEPDRRGFDGYICNNPALLHHPNGQFWIFYKGRDVAKQVDGGYVPAGMGIGVAVAERLEGPYRKHPANPLFDVSPTMIEDPFAWSADGRIWLLISEVHSNRPLLCNDGGFVIHSADGVTWSDPRLAFESPLRMWGREQRLEEPNILFRDGRPAYLFNVLGACPEDPAYSGFVSRIHAWQP